MRTSRTVTTQHHRGRESASMEWPFCSDQCWPRPMWSNNSGSSSPPPHPAQIATEIAALAGGPAELERRLFAFWGIGGSRPEGDRVVGPGWLGTPDAARYLGLCRADAVSIDRRGYLAGLSLGWVALSGSSERSRRVRRAGEDRAGARSRTVIRGAISTTRRVSRFGPRQGPWMRVRPSTHPVQLFSQTISAQSPHRFVVAT